jgi:cobalt transporter subunit CbtB
MTGSRCDSGAVLATVMGKRNPRSHWAAAWEGGWSVDPRARRPVAPDIHEVMEPRSRAMATTTITETRQAPAIHVPLWAWLALVVAMLGAYVMLQENGLVLSQWETLHEFFHDGRHALGFPCH